MSAITPRTGRGRLGLDMPWGMRAGAVAAAAVALAGLWLAGKAGVKHFGAVPGALQTWAAIFLLFGAPGYPLARRLLPGSLMAHLPLFVLPIGAAGAALSLTVLGFAGLPLTLSLIVVVVAGVVSGAVLRVRHGPAAAPPAELERAGGVIVRVAWPAYLAAVIAAVALVPMFRANHATLTGQNGDAVLAVGTAELLQKTPPWATDTNLYVDRMTRNWRSKYPIYYALAGVSRLSGLRVEQAFPTVIATTLALAAVGFMLLAFHVLSAGAVGALLAMALVGLDRIMLYLALGPFYNQIWGLFSLPFILLFGFRFLQEPTAATGTLAAVFLALGAFAYPLMLPFPVVALGLCAVILWRCERAAGRRPAWLPRLRRPRGRRALILGVPLALVAAPAVVVVLVGVYEKTSSALTVILPGSDLSGWNALPTYLPFHLFYGFTDPLGLAWLAVAAVVAAAGYGLWRLPREVGLPLLAMCGGALLFAAYFKARHQGAFFYFKVNGFLGPVVLAAAVCALAGVARESAGAWARRGAGAAVALMALFAVDGARVEIARTGELFPREVLALRDWSERIPRDASVLLAVPTGLQLDAEFMLSAHPVSAPQPFGSTTFPYPPQGFKADYLLIAPRPPRRLVVGGPAFENRRFRLWRMRPGLPGRDRSSRETSAGFIPARP